MPSRPGPSRRRFLLGSTAAGGMLALDRLPARAEAIAPESFGLRDAVSLSIGNTVREGLTDVPWLPKPFELELLSADPETRRTVALRAAEIVAQAQFKAKNFSAIESVTIPKRNYSTRRYVAAMEPMDHVVYLALALLAAPAIERKRVPREDKVVFSYRLAPRQGRIFDAQSNIHAFLRASRQGGRAGNYVAGCDIANFYEHLSPEAIAGALGDCAVAPEIAGYIGGLLDFWSRQGSVGLPCGSNSSRILAEAVLDRVDRALQTEGIAFIRYVDDYRVFAQSSAGARRGLELIGYYLEREGMFLNPAKTRLWLPDDNASGPGRAGDWTEYRRTLLHRIGQAGPEQPTFPDQNVPGVPGPNPFNPYYPGPLVPGTNPDDSGPTLPDRPYPPYDLPNDPWNPRIPQPPEQRYAPGYAGIVPRYARRPGEKELEAMRQDDRASDPAPFLTGELAHAEAVRHAIRNAVFGGHGDFVKAIPALMARYPEFTCYTVSALIKGSQYLSADIRRNVSGRLAAALFTPGTESFIKPKILELISHADYRERAAIERYARACADTPYGMQWRWALDALRRTGGIPEDLRALYGNTDGASRRALLADAIERGTVPPPGADMTEPFAARLIAVAASSTSAPRDARLVRRALSADA